MCDKCKLNSEDEKFLRARDKNSAASGAMVKEINEDVEDLRKRVEDTDRKLRFLF